MTRSPAATISYIPSSVKWWRGEGSNLRRLRRQIYSLLPLATREPLHYCQPSIPGSSKPKQACTDSTGYRQRQSLFCTRLQIPCWVRLPRAIRDPVSPDSSLPAVPGRRPCYDQVATAFSTPLFHLSSCSDTSFDTPTSYPRQCQFRNSVIQHHTVIPAKARIQEKQPRMTKQLQDIGKCLEVNWKTR